MYAVRMSEHIIVAASASTASVAAVEYLAAAAAAKQAAYMISLASLLQQLCLKLKVLRVEVRSVLLGTSKSCQRDVYVVLSFGESAPSSEGARVLVFCLHAGS